LLACSAASRALLPFPTRRSSDLCGVGAGVGFLGGERLTELDRGFGRADDGAVVGGALDGAGGGGAVGAGWREIERGSDDAGDARSEEHTSELQSLTNLVCRLLLD